MPHVIAEPCIGVKDKACASVCPVQAINGSDDTPQFYINPDECLDCGACMSACPVEAIYPDTDLPEKWQNYIEVNAEFYK